MKTQYDRYTTGEKSFSRKEWDKFIGVVDILEDEVLFKTCVICGIRREDICHGTVRKWVNKQKVPVVTGILINDINFEMNTITFREHKKNKNHTVPISPALSLLIKKLINSRGRVQSPYLITYSGATAYRKVQTYCEKAGIPPRPFHALRATCIKFCQANGWSAEQVARLVDDTISVIQQHYSTPSESEMREIATNNAILI